MNSVPGEIAFVSNRSGTCLPCAWRLVLRSSASLALRNLLVQSDHYLRDIGLERYQLEALQSNGGYLDELVRGRKKTGVGRLRLVPDARIGDGKVHVLDRAA